jgi:hypothetical protein
MKPRNRSLSGALIAVLALPVFLGLLACIPSFPVPIGDPEKSRIDPAISGMWVAGDVDGLAVWWFIPYDKRTWLMTWYSIEVDDDCEPDDLPPEADITTYEELRDFVNEADACLHAAPVLTWKVWNTQLGGRQFLTLENKTFYAPNEPTDEDFWMVYGVDLPSSNLLQLKEVDSEDAAFVDIDVQKGTRRQYERVFRKQAKNPEFYESDPEEMFRVQDDDLELFGDIILELFEM